MITNMLLFMGLGAQEVIIILVIILLLFGGKKIPELAKGIGKGIKEFRNASKDDDSSESKNDGGNSSE